MIFTIDTLPSLNKYLPQLITNYISMFSESPFNNPNITNEVAKEFFINTFINGLIFVNTYSSTDIIVGFRTVIKSEKFKDFDKLNLDDNSIYLSCLWISKNLRNTSLGNNLMTYSLSIVRKNFNPKSIYVRTRNDTPGILHLLKSKGFTQINKYPVIINNQELELLLHKLEF